MTCYNLTTKQDRKNLMKKRTKLTKLPDVEVKIIKMCESSGNEQFFVRLVRTDFGDDPFFTDGIIEHSCWQTKKNDFTMPKKECLARAWFDAGFLARFVGLKSMNEVLIVGLDEEETAILKSSMTLFREEKEEK